ncbi:hypothetical protein WH96_04835 [Kiloniella spongiae]|uniref:Uncharacterized protein n=1 Tax=Kiloniella spongiae TaxID=1489064 RepID=A0A0H2MHK8_9PROT|nr:hypothetical protein [Kiloniella spongiae]KLN61666.1 hypothetical protein WH96_04835 [Kiloniella spongiae]
MHDLEAAKIVSYISPKYPNILNLRDKPGTDPTIDTGTLNPRNKRVIPSKLMFLLNTSILRTGKKIKETLILKNKQRTL